DAHTAAADFMADDVGADFAAGRRLARFVHQELGGNFVGRRFEKAGGCVVRVKEGNDFVPKGGIAGTGGIDDGAGSAGRAGHGVVEDRANARPLFGRHDEGSAPSSRASHAFASAQRRFTVAGEMPSASAASSIDSPPKKRTSTRWASSGSNAASLVSA